MLAITVQYCSVGLCVWLFTYLVNRVWLMFKGLMV